MLTAGFAVTVAPVVVFSPAVGVHANVEGLIELVAVRFTGPHWLFGSTVTVGTGFTVIVGVPLKLGPRQPLALATDTRE